MSRRRDVPKGTKLGDLKKIAGFDLGLYMIDDEWSSKWQLQPNDPRIGTKIGIVKHNLKQFKNLIAIFHREVEMLERDIEHLEEE
jgi:hypothetical protein